MAIGRRNLKNNWATALDVAAAAADTTLSLPQAWIDKLTSPNPSSTQWYELTLDDGVQAPEIVRCTGKGTGTVTVTRAQQGTVAPTTWGVGTKVEIRITAELARVLEFSRWVSSSLCIGPNAGEDITSGQFNALFGDGSGLNITTGTGNTGNGYFTLSAETTGSYNTASGYNAGSGLAADSNYVVAIGHYAASAAGNAVQRATYLGAAADNGVPGLSDVICLGYGATAYTANTAVIGSQSSRIADVHIGGGQRDSAAAQVTLQASAGSGTDKAGGTLRLAGGKSTGAGAPGKVIIATGTAGASGSAENTLTNRAEWDTAGLFWTYAGLKTGNPGAGAGTWKLGTVQAGAVTLDTANYVEVDIGGSVVKLLKAA